MELRKDPITRSWVITGDAAESVRADEILCRFCADAPVQPQVVSSMAFGGWRPLVRARSRASHTALPRRGDPQRRGEGIYDRMKSVGAHEVLVENFRHDRPLWSSSDAEIERFLLLAAQRIQDLKRDQRFKYISIFKDHGSVAGQEFEHPTSQLTATTFVPRRVLYELRAGRDYYGRRSVVFSATFCPRRNGKRCASWKVAETMLLYVPTHLACPMRPGCFLATTNPPLNVPRASSRDNAGLGGPVAPHLEPHS